MLALTLADPRTDSLPFSPTLSATPSSSSSSSSHTLQSLVVPLAGVCIVRSPSYTTGQVIFTRHLGPQESRLRPTYRTYATPALTPLGSGLSILHPCPWLPLLATGARCPDDKAKGIAQCLPPVSVPSRPVPIQSQSLSRGLSALCRVAALGLYHARHFAAPRHHTTTPATASNVPRPLLDRPRPRPSTP